MRVLKTLGLAVIAASALIALGGTGTASATVLCSTTAEPCPEGQKWPNETALDFSVASGGSFLWENAGTVIDTCKGVTLRTHIANAGGASSTVSTSNKELLWSNCTFPTKTQMLGGLEIHKESGTSNGAVTASEEINWTINTILWGSCIYAWKAGRGFGTLTEGNPAILHVNSTIEKVSGSNAACPATGTLVGTLTLTAPTGTTLSVEAS